MADPNIVEHLGAAADDLLSHVSETIPVDGVDYHTAADLTGQANYLGVTIEADIIKQKLPTNNGGYTAVSRASKAAGDGGYGVTSPQMYDKLSSDHPIDLTRYQVANCYMGALASSIRAGLLVQTTSRMPPGRP